MKSEGNLMSDALDQLVGSQSLNFLALFACLVSVFYISLLACVFRVSWCLIYFELRWY